MLLLTDIKSGTDVYSNNTEQIYLPCVQKPSSNETL